MATAPALSIDASRFSDLVSRNLRLLSPVFRRRRQQLEASSVGFLTSPHIDDSQLIADRSSPCILELPASSLPSSDLLPIGLVVPTPMGSFSCRVSRRSLQGGDLMYLPVGSRYRPTGSPFNFLRILWDR